MFCLCHVSGSHSHVFLSRRINQTYAMLADMTTDDFGHWLARLWETNPWLAFAGAVLALLALVLVVVGVVRLFRAARGASNTLKMVVGTTVVQAGVTWVVVTGTHDFGIKVFELKVEEAYALAVFLEAATWVAVAMIIDHGKGVNEENQPNTGFGSAGPFFWLFSVLGGLLAVVAGASWGEMTGRAVVVVFGTCLWYLVLLRKTRRSGKPGTFRWTPRAALVALGAIEPGDTDVADENREWQIRRLARAMRWSNSAWPWSWLGARSLVKRAETTAEDVINAARRRYAVAHLLTTNVKPESAVMRRVIAGIGGATDPVDTDTRALLDEVRLGARVAARKLRAELPPPDQFWSNNVVRIPTSLMDKVRTAPVDQPAVRQLDQRPVQSVVQNVDQIQDHSDRPNVDQPKQVDQQVNARSNRRPSAPADDVPPRVQDMAKALRKRYRGEIPSRRTVMPVMGWTNSQDAQAAINLVRAERAEQTNHTDRAAV